MLLIKLNKKKIHHTYIQTYIHTYTHTCIHKYIHTYIPTYTHTYIHTHTHTHIPTNKHALTHILCTLPEPPVPNFWWNNTFCWPILCIIISPNVSVPVLSYSRIQLRCCWQSVKKCAPSLFRSQVLISVLRLGDAYFFSTNRLETNKLTCWTPTVIPTPLNGCFDYFLRCLLQGCY